METQHVNLPDGAQENSINSEPIKEKAFMRIGKTALSIIAVVVLTIIMAVIMITTGLGSAHPG